MSAYILVKYRGKQFSFPTTCKVVLCFFQLVNIKIYLLWFKPSLTYSTLFETYSCSVLLSNKHTLVLIAPSQTLFLLSEH